MNMAAAATLPGRARAKPTSGHARIVGFLQILALLAVAVDGLFVSFGAAHINSERIVLMPIVLMVVYAAVVERRLHITAATKFYFLWTVTVLFSLLLSFAPSKHVNGLLISVAPFVYFLLFSERSFRFDNVGRSIEAWIWCVGVGSLVSYAIWLASGQLDFMVDRGRPHFLMFEPNILGAVMAAMLLAHFAFFRPTLRHFALHAVGLLTLLCAASRFPYAAYAIGLVYYLIRSGLIRRPIVVFALALGLVVVAAGLGLFFDRIADAYTNNLDRIDAVDNRMVTLAFAWERFLVHPIIGNGPLDFSLTGFGVLGQIGSTDARDLWIWQIWVAILHDEGIIGLLFYLGFLVAAWRRTQLMIKQGHSYFLAYQCAAISLVISSQGTTEHLTAAWGVIFGLANSPPLAAGVARKATRGARQARAIMAGAGARSLPRGARQAWPASNPRAAPPRMPTR